MKIKILKKCKFYNRWLRKDEVLEGVFLGDAKRLIAEKKAVELTNKEDK